MESFNLATRPQGYKLYGPDEPTSTEYALLGPDSLGRYYSVGQGPAAFIKQRTAHGEYLVFFSAAASEQFRCGALDSWGRVWTGDIANYSVQPHGPDGYPTTTVTLTDGVENFQPWGMLFDSGYLYVCGIGVVNEEIKLFRIDVTVGSEAVVAWSDGVASLVSPPIQEALDIAKDPNGDYWVAEGSRQGELIRFSGGYLAPTLVSLSAPANCGLHRVHYAFEHLWVGGDAQQGVGAGDPQILKVKLDGTVAGSAAITRTQRLGGFASDADNLYVARAAYFGAGTSPNRVLVVNPVTVSVSSSFLFGGSAPSSRDGFGEPPRQLLCVTDEKYFEYPEPSFYDALLWFRGDDPKFSSYASIVFGVPNRGPQGKLPALAPRRGRPIVDGLNGIQAVAFDAARQDLRLPKKPTYSTKSVGFGVATERVNFGTTFDLQYTSSFSISVWVRSFADVQQAILGKMQAPTTLRGYAVSLTAVGKVLFELYNDHGAGNRLAVQTTESGFNDGLWHHICVVCVGTVSAANTKIYVDNSDEPLTTIYDTLSATTVSTGELWAGGRSATGDEKWFHGLVSDLALYNIALAAGDVADIWNEGAPGDLALLGTVGNLTAWWRMGTGDTYPTILNKIFLGINGTMVNMAPRALAPEAPEEEEEVDDLHTEEELTILVAFASFSPLTTQTIFSTMDSALTQSSIGAALYYDGTAESVRFVVANGSGSSWAVNHTTAAGSVPQSTPILLAIRLDPAATPALNIRIWVIPQLLEFVEETAVLAGSFSSASGGKFSVGSGPEGALEGAIGEVAILRRKLPDVELSAAVRHLRRWLP